MCYWSSLINTICITRKFKNSSVLHNLCFPKNVKELLFQNFPLENSFQNNLFGVFFIFFKFAYFFYHLENFTTELTLEV